MEEVEIGIKLLYICLEKWYIVYRSKSMEAAQIINTPSFDTVWALVKEVAENQKETDRQMKETDRTIKEIGKRLGDFTNSFGAVAGIVVEDDEREYALNNGFYLIEPSGENFNITKPHGKPKEW